MAAQGLVRLSTPDLGAAGRAVRLGMLTPSSNTTLEPVTTAMLVGLPGVSAHFSRFRVTEIGLGARALGQFDDSAILAAAELLAHARVQVIGWSGTSAGWRGFDADLRLCERITAATGMPACTSVLAFNELFARAGLRRLALVTPYVADVQQAIMANYARIGIETVAEQHLGLADNFSFAEVDAPTLTAMAQAVAAARPDGIAIYCTNLRGGPLAHALERALGIPVYDSVAAVVWKALLLAGVDPAAVRGWGGLFAAGAADNRG